jgi:hypothetical protein
MLPMALEAKVLTSGAGVRLTVAEVRRLSPSSAIEIAEQKRRITIRPADQSGFRVESRLERVFLRHSLPSEQY